jgi:ferredoxin-NADP reductase
MQTEGMSAARAKRIIEQETETAHLKTLMTAKEIFEAEMRVNAALAKQAQAREMARVAAEGERKSIAAQNAAEFDRAAKVQTDTLKRLAVSAGAPAWQFEPKGFMQDAARLTEELAKAKEGTKIPGFGISSRDSQRMRFGEVKGGMTFGEQNEQAKTAKNTEAMKKILTEIRDLFKRNNFAVPMGLAP